MSALFNSYDHLEDSINGDKFSDFSDFTWNDREKRLDGILNKSGVVFCKTDFIEDLFELIKDSSHKYILITHNSDHNINEERYNKKPKNILLWFAQNVIIQRYDLIPIPIGLERPGVAGSGNIQDFFDNLLKPVDKNNLLYMGFSDSTNEKRPIIKNYLKQFEWVTNDEERIPFKDFLQKLQSHKFIIAPPGNGSDCHRTWEAYYCNSIPICERNIHNEVFFSIIPMILYSNVEEITEGYLINQYKIIKKKIANNIYSFMALRFTFWKELIEFYARSML
jgi:hypothetical protein